MGVISNVDVQTRLDIREMLSRFCHAIDHADECGWARLFTQDVKLSSELCGEYIGREDILKLPHKMQERGNGFWRHAFTNIVIDRSGNNRELTVRAYCTVTDWSDGGKPVFFADYDITVRKTCQWQIASMKANAIRADGMPIPVTASTIASARPSVN